MIIDDDGWMDGLIIQNPNQNDFILNPILPMTPFFQTTCLRFSFINMNQGITFNNSFSQLHSSLMFRRF